MFQVWQYLQSSVFTTITGEYRSHSPLVICTQYSTITLSFIILYLTLLLQIVHAMYSFMYFGVFLDNKAMYFIVLHCVALRLLNDWVLSLLLITVDVWSRFSFLLSIFCCAVRTYVRPMCRIVALLCSVRFLYALVIWFVACEQHSWLPLHKDVYIN